MTRRLPLSALAAFIQETIEQVFLDETFWVIAEITDVKKYEQKRWCFLKFIEKNKDYIATEMQGVFWANGYQEILRFERTTGQSFGNGIEISCRVAVRFHPRYGLKLEVLEIDTAFTLGQLERERQQTLDKLLLLFPHHIQLIDGTYITLNKQLTLPKVLQRVALIAAPGSDGHRDFLHELRHNAYGYHFEFTEFPATVQGITAADSIAQQLDLIHQTASSFDVVALVRGGGSNTDFAPFDHFEVARRVALFPLPVFTGIGHDRNTSIADLMGWQYKTPTKVAAAIVDMALRFDSELGSIKDKITDTCMAVVLDKQNQLHHWQQKIGWHIPQRLRYTKEQLQQIQVALVRNGKERIQWRLKQLKDHQKQMEMLANFRLSEKKSELAQTARMVEQLSPQSILNRGFAMVMQQDQIITRKSELQPDQPLITQLKDARIISDIQEIASYDRKDI